jgi:hypothetical protein
MNEPVIDLAAKQRELEAKRAREGIPAPNPGSAAQPSAPARSPKIRGPHEGTATAVDDKPAVDPKAYDGQPDDLQNDSAAWAEEDAVLDAIEKAEKSLPDYRDTLLPEGEIVEVRFVSAAASNIGVASKWMLLFKIVMPDRFAGKVILGSYNPPRGPFLSTRHALYADWLAVVGRPLRSLPKRLSPEALLASFLRDCQVRAKTCVVNRRMDQKLRKWVETPKSEHYSRIDFLVTRTSGTPRALQHRKRREKKS